MSHIDAQREAHDARVDLMLARADELAELIEEFDWLAVQQETLNGLHPDLPPNSPYTDALSRMMARVERFLQEELP